MTAKTGLRLVMGAAALLLCGLIGGNAGAGDTAVAAHPLPAAGRAPVAAATPSARQFPETGQTVSGGFLTYWTGHGGLAQQGFPLSNVFTETSDLNNKTYRVQYFERAVFEYHPENAAPFDVLLSQLGTVRYKAKYPNGAPGAQAGTDNPRKFAETGKTLAGRFRAYWEAHGGLAQQGFPISDEFTETSELNGKPYRVQYFERAVFEYHPENAAPFDVLLSQLGTFQYKAKYPTGTGATGAVLDLTNNCLLGGVINGQWRDSAAISTTLKGGEPYRVYNLTAPLGAATGTAPASIGEPCEDTLQVDLRPQTSGATLAVGGTWNPQPRLARAESTTQEVYRQAAAVVLRDHGIANPHVQLTQVLRADLDGDGESEVLVTATYYANGAFPPATAGDYSMVFLRKVVAGKVETVVLDGNFYPKAVEFGASVTFNVTSLLDLNGDGTLEVVVSARYYEGAGTTVYEINGTQSKEVLSCACGS